MDRKSIIKNRGKELRLQGTPAEKILWSKLRNRQMKGVKFRRQQPLWNYIVDFVNYEKKFIIEVDGGQHNKGTILNQDATRTAWLNSQGFQVIRFWNNEVMENLEGVLLKIQAAVDNQAPSPFNSSPIEGEENGKF